MSEISLREFIEKILGITLHESQLKLLENPGKMKIGPIRKHGKKYFQIHRVTRRSKD